MRKFRKMNETYQAIVYVYHNDETNQLVYVGHHKTDNEHDGYISSSKNPRFKQLWERGLLRRNVIYRGSLEECVSMESYFLKTIKATQNKNLLNETNGGGAGCDMKLVTKNMKEIIDKVINNTFKETSYIEHNVMYDIELAETIVERIKTGHYPVLWVPISQVYESNASQVREIYIDNEHVSNIAEKLRNPIEAKKHLDPIVFSVKEGSITTVNGNHTKHALIEAGYETVPVIYINSKEFEDKQSVIKNVGVILNKKEKLAKGNSPADCKKRILEVAHEQNLELSSDLLKQAVIRLYYPEFSETQISANIRVLLDKHYDDKKKQDLNFYTWSEKQLREEVDNILNKDPYRGCISQSSDRAINSGVGGVINSFYNNLESAPGYLRESLEKEPKGYIVVYHNSMKHYNNRKELRSQLLRNLQAVNFPVEIIDLPCFYDAKSRQFFHDPK